MKSKARQDSGSEGVRAGQQNRPVPVQLESELALPARHRRHPIDLLGQEVAPGTVRDPSPQDPSGRREIPLISGLVEASESLLGGVEGREHRCDRGATTDKLAGHPGRCLGLGDRLASLPGTEEGLGTLERPDRLPGAGQSG